MAFFLSFKTFGKAASELALDTLTELLVILRFLSAGKFF